MGKHSFLKSHAKRSYKRSLPSEEKKKEVVEVLENRFMESEVNEVESKEVIVISDDILKEELASRKYVKNINSNKIC